MIKLKRELIRTGRLPQLSGLTSPTWCPPPPGKQLVFPSLLVETSFQKCPVRQVIRSNRCKFLVTESTNNFLSNKSESISKKLKKVKYTRDNRIRWRRTNVKAFFKWNQFITINTPVCKTKNLDYRCRISCMTFFVLLIRNEPVIIKWNSCVRSESERGRIKKKYNWKNCLKSLVTNLLSIK